MQKNSGEISRNEPTRTVHRQASSGCPPASTRTKSLFLLHFWSPPTLEGEMYAHHGS